MATEHLIHQLNAFVPSGVETADVEHLYSITNALEAAAAVQTAIPAMLRVFERNPDVDLGSQGPLVHSIETCGIMGFLDDLLASLKHQPVIMTIWMAERCLRSQLQGHQRNAIIEVLRDVAKHPTASDEVKSNASEAVDEYAV